MVVTPLRDGMNLVAKEYVACRHDLRGALVLSEFAGAADELRQAFLVNPYDVEGSSGRCCRDAGHAARAGPPDALDAPPGGDLRRGPLGRESSSPPWRTHGWLLSRPPSRSSLALLAAVRVTTICAT